MRVLAMGYRGVPLDRVVTGHARGLAYLINSSVVNATEPAEFAGVGFPEMAVFEFDGRLYDSLCGAWEHRNQDELRALWRQASPAFVDLEARQVVEAYL